MSGSTSIYLHTATLTTSPTTYSRCSSPPLDFVFNALQLPVYLTGVSYFSNCISVLPLNLLMVPQHHGRNNIQVGSSTCPKSIPSTISSIAFSYL